MEKGIVLISLESRIAAVAGESLAVALAGMEEGAVAAGLSSGTARTLARQALLGTAALLEDVHESAAALKERVASPGGTTIVGLAALEDEGIRGALIRAVRDCAVPGGEEGSGE